METKEQILDRIADENCWVLAKDLEQYVILPAMEQFAEISKNDVIDSIIIDLTRRGFFLNPSKMKSQMLEVIRSHKNSNVDSDSD